MSKTASTAPFRKSVTCWGAIDSVCGCPGSPSRGETPMPLVNVLVNGRAYTVACDKGEEDHVRDLGQFLGGRVRQLSESVGQVGDARLLLMAGLVVCDELTEALAKLEEREQEIAALKAAHDADAEILEIQ